MHIYRDMTLGEYLTRHRYSSGFMHNYVVPMSAAVWSVPNTQVGLAPVALRLLLLRKHALRTCGPGEGEGGPACQQA